MKSGKARLVLVMLLTSVLVGSLATLSCGGSSKKSETPTPRPPAATNTPMVVPTGTPAALKPTQTPSTPQAQQASVTIKDFEFAPSTVTIKVGGTVTWTNDGPSAHTVTADDGSFNSGELQKGKTFSRTFDSTGTFSYHCSIHPSMKAQVVVEK
jgi:plastocyanin